MNNLVVTQTWKNKSSTEDRRSIKGNYYNNKEVYFLRKLSSSKCKMSFSWTVKVQLDHKLALEIVTFPLYGKIILSQVVEIFSLKWLWPVFHHLLNFLTESISFFTTFFDEKWMSWWYTIQHKISKQVLTYRTLFFDSTSIYMEEIHTTFAGKTKIPVVEDFFSV